MGDKSVSFAYRWQSNRLTLFDGQNGLGVAPDGQGRVFFCRWHTFTAASPQNFKAD